MPVSPTSVLIKKEIVFTRMIALLHVSSILRGLNGVLVLSHVVVTVRRQEPEFVSVVLPVMGPLPKHSLVYVETNHVQSSNNAAILLTLVKARGHIDDMISIKVGPYF